MPNLPSNPRAIVAIASASCGGAVGRRGGAATGTGIETNTGGRRHRRARAGIGALGRSAPGKGQRRDERRRLREPHRFDHDTHHYWHFTPDFP